MEKRKLDITNFIPKKLGGYGHTKYINFGGGNISIIEVFVSNILKTEEAKALQAKIIDKCKEWNEKTPDKPVAILILDLVDYKENRLPHCAMETIDLLEKEKLISSDEHLKAVIGEGIQKEYCIQTDKGDGFSLKYSSRKEWISTIYKIVGADGVIPDHLPKPRDR